MSFLYRIRSHNLATFWMFSVIGGAVLISVSSGQQVGRLFLPLTMMFAYLVYGLSQRSRNTTKLADSLYFMGFLWTLYALIDSLISRGSKISSADVFIVFGYALVTTGIGMFLRLALMQFQATVPDQLLESSEEIETRVASFVGELANAQKDFSDWRARARETIEGWMQDLIETTSRLQSEIERLHTDAVRKVADQLSSEATNLVSTLAAVERELGALTMAVGTIGRQLGRGSTLLENRMTKLDRMLETRFGQLEVSVGGIASRLERIQIPEDLVVNKFDAAWSKVEPSVLRVGSSFDGASQSAAGFQAQSAAVTRELESMKARFELVHQGTTELVSLLDVLRKHNVDLDAEVVLRSAAHIAAVDKAIADVHALGQQLETVVAEVLAFVRTHLSESMR